MASKRVGAPPASGSSMKASDVGSFILRLGLGAIAVSQAYPSLSGLFEGGGVANPYAKVTESLGLPVALGPAMVWALAVSGVLLVLGLATRFAALLVALAVGFDLYARSTTGVEWVEIELPVMLVCAALALLAGGGGSIALERLFKRRKK